MASQQNKFIDRAAIVLCGGKSSRMGRAKADLPFGNETMLKRVVRLLSDTVSRIVLVAAAEQVVPEFEPSLAARVSVARDELTFAGPLAGLNVGLQKLRSLSEKTEATYVTSCDVPFLKPAFVHELFEQLCESHDIVVPKDEKFHHPLAAVYRVSVAPHVANLVEAGERRPRALFDQVRTLRVDTKSLEHVDPKLETLLNLNTPDDYRAALAKQGVPIPA